MLLDYFRFMYLKLHFTCDLIYHVTDYADSEGLTALGCSDINIRGLKFINFNDYYNPLKHKPNFLSKSYHQNYTILNFAFPVSTLMSEYIGVYQLDDRLISFYVHQALNSQQRKVYLKFIDAGKNSMLILKGLDHLQKLLRDQPFNDYIHEDSKLEQLYFTCKSLASLKDQGVEISIDLLTKRFQNRIIAGDKTLLNLIYKLIRCFEPKNKLCVEMQKCLSGYLTFTRAIAFKKNHLFKYSLEIYDSQDKMVKSLSINDKTFGDMIVLSRSDIFIDTWSKICLRINFKGNSIIKDITRFAQNILN